MPYRYLVLLICLVLSGCATFERHCSEGWKITGYYTPVEADFSSATRSNIEIQNIGTQSFSKDFLAAVRIEGWGKTRQGWFLGYYSNSWHKSSHPLNARGQKLQIGNIATDPKLISTGTKLSVPTLNAWLATAKFTATDVGSAIQGKHIDIYVGEGTLGKQRSWDITGDNHHVCI